MLKQQTKRIISVAGLLIGLGWLTGCGAQMTDAERIEQARTELAQGQAAAAAIHMRNVLQDDPSNVDARLLLAEAALQTGDMDAAAKEYRRALDLGAELDPIRASYAEALVRLGAAEEAIRITDPQETGGSPELAYWHALALLRTGDLDGADAALQTAEQDPEMRLLAEIARARIVAARGDVDTALAMLAALPPEAEESTEYWGVLAFGSMRTGDIDTAVKAFARAEETVVDTSGRQQLLYRSGRVEALLANGDLDTARALAQEIHTQAPQHPATNYLMGRVELQAGNPQQALAHAQAVLAAQPGSAQGLLLAAMAHMALGQELQAESNLERAVVANPADLNARRLLAQVRLGLQSPERALEALGPLTDEAIEQGVGTLAGVASVRAGDPEAAVEIFRRQLETEPDNDEVRSMLAVSLIAVGRVDEALAELGMIKGTDAAARQRVDLITIAAQLQEGRTAEAREIAGRLAEENPDDASLRATLGGLFLYANRVDEAVAWMEDALRLDPGHVAAHFNLGRIAAVRGDLAAARDHFTAIVENNPGNTAALSALAQLDWAAGDREAAVARLQQARAADPEDANVRVLLASYLGSNQDWTGAIEVAREAVAADPDSAEAANALGVVLLRAGEAREALGEFARAHQLAPTSPLFLVNRARAERATNQPEAARETLVSALALDPGNYQALLHITDLERQLGRFDDAARSLARLEQAAEPGDARVSLLRGDILVARGEYAAAQAAYEAAGEQGGGNRAVVGQFRARLGQGAAEPEAPMLTWLAQNPGDTAVRLVLAAHYVNAAEYRKAIPQYEQLLAESPDNAMYMNNLAWLYNEVGDGRAEDFAQRAYTAAPDNPMIADTLGWILYQKGDTARALELVREAAEAAPRVGEIQYHLAVLLAETGDVSGAIRAARAVLAEPGAMNHHEQAQKLLDRLEGER
ncbi:XrtA/PEP-CTERM system TPR-repeat protein PrsT [Thioalkalivibrio sp. XN279]|uniref:XrtA/PEP-CTERM system TPR-repeat protein PrsT n=1 Tax=Thioalkalivibrio sp. XN279 TaxID=2714953 RepID=UPI00140726E6|nr:XrtA/PEP-CTERM system TPR-repeat protein PrsT [Thioalkalivibrio sp. XN279]NHA15390.1 PEP-CTERM system TPR-repeat protein PrsT [Thioalkalivibrio sp. XN279]